MEKIDTLKKYQEELQISIWIGELDIRYFERKKIKYAQSPHLTEISNAITALRARTSIAQEKIDLISDVIKELEEKKQPTVSKKNK